MYVYVHTNMHAKSFIFEDVHGRNLALLLFEQFSTLVACIAHLPNEADFTADGTWAIEGVLLAGKGWFAIKLTYVFFNPNNEKISMV